MGTSVDVETVESPSAVSSRATTHPVAVLAWLRLARVYHKVDRATARLLKPWGLTVAQFDVIVQVGAAEGLMQQDLADKLLVTKGNVTQVLDRLEKDGLVERRLHGRAKKLYLTPRGRFLHDDVLPAQEGMIGLAFSALPPREHSSLLAALRALDRTLG